MGMKTTAVAVVLVAAAWLLFATRGPEVETPDTAKVEEGVGEEERSNADLVSPERASEASTTRQVEQVEEGPGEDRTVTAGSHVLRVIVEGITEEEARGAKVSLSLRDDQDDRIVGIEGSWSCQGLTSEFDLDPLFARVAEEYGDRRVEVLDVNVDSPEHVSERTRVLVSRDGERMEGGTVYVARVLLALPEYWPEFTLSVRDAHTRAHLEDVELSFMPGASTAMWGRNSPSTYLADHLDSPIVMMGGRNAAEPEGRVKHLGVRVGDSTKLVKMAYGAPTRFGYVVSARAPGYSWGSIALDLSSTEERELLLKPGSEIDVQFTNVQLERYEALGVRAMLAVYWIREDKGNQYVHFAELDEALEDEGLLVRGLRPGGYRVAVELDGGSWAERPKLAFEEIELNADAPRELVLALADAPALPEDVSLGGLVSFPAFGGEEDVRLQLFLGNWGYGAEPREISLADMVRVGGALPTWSFRLEDVPVGTHQIRLMPFMKNWMVEVPDGGRDDVALVIPELAEVRVETVDAGNGERIPLEKLRYICMEEVPGRVHHIWSDQIWDEFEGERGLFRLWMPPGDAMITSWQIPSELGYASNSMQLELVPGLQSVQLELAPPCRIQFVFRADGGETRRSDGIWDWVHYGTLKSVRAVEHDGRCKGRMGDGLIEVSAPGVYEIDFEGLTGDLFHPLQPRLVEVRAGETLEVVVELQRK